MVFSMSHVLTDALWLKRAATLVVESGLPTTVLIALKYVIRYVVMY
jgi:hypothetical protein